MALKIISYVLCLGILIKLPENKVHNEPKTQPRCTGKSVQLLERHDWW